MSCMLSFACPESETKIFTRKIDWRHIIGKLLEIIRQPNTVLFIKRQREKKQKTWTKFLNFKTELAISNWNRKCFGCDWMRMNMLLMLYFCVFLSDLYIFKNEMNLNWIYYPENKANKLKKKINFFCVCEMFTESLWIVFVYQSISIKTKMKYTETKWNGTKQNAIDIYCWSLIVVCCSAIDSQNLTHFARLFCIVRCSNNSLLFFFAHWISNWNGNWIEWMKKTVIIAYTIQNIQRVPTNCCLFIFYRNMKAKKKRTKTIQKWITSNHRCDWYCVWIMVDVIEVDQTRCTAVFEWK